MEAEPQVQAGEAGPRLAAGLEQPAAQPEPQRAVAQVRAPQLGRLDHQLGRLDADGAAPLQQQLAAAGQLRRGVEEQRLGVAHVHQVERGVEHLGLRGRPALRQRLGRVGHQRLHGAGLGGGEVADPGLELAAHGGPVVDRPDQAAVPVEHLHGVGRHHQRHEGERLDEGEARRRRLERAEDVVAAVLVEVPVVHPGAAQLPEVGHQHGHLARLERQVVLPEVARLAVGVLAHLVVVRVVAELAVEEARAAP